MRRPLLLPALLLAAGVVAEEFFGGRWPWLFAATALVIGLALIHESRRTLWLATGLFLAGWLNYALQQSAIAPQDLRRIAGSEPEIVTVRGEIAETPTLRLSERKGQLRGRMMVRLHTSALRREHGGWQPATGELIVSSPGALRPEYFRTQRVEVTGVLQSPPGPAAEGLFDYRTFLRRQGVWFTLRSDGDADWRLAADGVASAPLSERFLPWAQATLARGLPDDEAARLLAAMALGWKTPLTGEVDEVFMQSGTMHVFAISGLHIALIAGLLVQLLRLVRLSRAWCGVVAVPLIWFYVAATGWQASAIRSAIMSTMVVGGWALERPGDLLNSLAAAALAILVWDPGQLFQAGFQLSFGAVAGLALVVPQVRPLLLGRLRFPADPFLPDELRSRWERGLQASLGWLALALSTCLGAFFSSLPLIWHYFQMLNPVSILANLVVVPLSGLALTANFASLITGGWWPGLGEVFNTSAWVCMRCMVALSRWFTGLPGGHWYVAAPAWGWWVPYYALLLGIVTGWAGRPGRRGWWAAGAGLWLLAAAFCFVDRQREMRVTILGGGEAIFIDAPWWRDDVLVDAGGESGATGLVIPFLRAHGVNRLPNFAVAMADVRSLGGASNVLAQLQPRRAILGPAKARSKAFTDFLKQAERLDIPQRHVAAGEEFAGWQVRHPAADDKFASADDNVLVLAREFAGIRVLLLSDAGRSAQRRLLASGEARADIVVTGIPHEGEPLGDALLDALTPQVMVVESGEYPAPLRLKAATRDRLALRNRRIVYTRDSGAVTLRFRDDGCELTAMDGTRLRTGPPVKRPPTAGAE
ncbi:MAG TPA: ComEC/Rec2 family competence protein [Candidatus Limnocylindria bacterium]|nr:ComEC/Rec2 family competence protein [Candidatus Limnocylindria bacterium]